LIGCSYTRYISYISAGNENSSRNAPEARITAVVDNLYKGGACWNDEKVNGSETLRGGEGRFAASRDGLR
jgi:hypothetical protein